MYGYGHVQRMRSNDQEIFIENKYVGRKEGVVIPCHKHPVSTKISYLKCSTRVGLCERTK